VLAATAILTTGLVAVAQLLTVSLQMHRLGTTWTEGSRLATAKIEELMKLNLTTAPSMQISPVNPDPLGQNVANYFDVPVAGVTRRWRVQAGPTASTRTLTVRVVPRTRNPLTDRQIELTTIVRQW
jgi:hypothetical protein